MLRYTAVFLSCLLAAAAAHASDYPSRPVTLVVPGPPGGTPDVVARMVAEKLRARLGQPVIVENKAGASGFIGTAAVAKAAPDGYTVLMGFAQTMAVNPATFKKLPYDPVQDFTPIARLVDFELALAVPGSTPARNFPELLSWLRAGRGKYSYGSFGAATPSQFAGDMLNRKAGLDMQHVPYKGSQPGVQALIANDVQLFIASYGIVAGQISAGRIRALAVAADQRLPALAQVPTTAEVGLPPGLILSNWWGIAAPKGTGKEIVDRLAEAFKRAVNDQDVQRKFVEQGTLPVASSSQQFADRMRDEAQSWKAIITKTGVTVE